MPVVFLGRVAPYVYGLSFVVSKGINIESRVDRKMLFRAAMDVH